MSADQAPGWYPDPGGQPATQRWWDGGTWSHVTRPAPEGAAPPPPAPRQPLTPREAGAVARAAKPTATPDGVALSGLFRRAAARVIDWLLLSTVSFVVAYPFLKPVVNAYRNWVDDAVAAAERGAAMPQFTLLQDVEVQASMRDYLFISVLLSALYTVPMLKLWGGTPGKLMLGVRVRSWEGDSRLTWGQALGRWLTGDAIGQIFVFYLVMDFLWPVWDQRRQALHDKLPGTVVVRSRQPVAAQQPLHAPWP